MDMRSTHIKSSAFTRRFIQTLNVILTVILVFLLATAGYLIYYGVAHNSFGTPSGQNSVSSKVNGAVGVAPTVASTPTQNAVSVAFTSGKSYGAGAAAVAWDPSGQNLAVAENPAVYGGSGNGGVLLFHQSGSNERLTGFEGYQAPGSLVWSHSGAMLAAAGHLTLIIWRPSAGSTPFKITLPADPGSDIYVFNVKTGVLAHTYSDSVFLPFGFADWGQAGAISPHTIAPANPLNPIAPTFALWGPEQGVGIFYDSAMGKTMIGASASDRVSHSALLRWSPQDDYIAWGYPTLPVSSVESSAGSQSAGQLQAVLSPNALFAAMVSKIGSAKSTSSVYITPSAIGSFVMITAFSAKGASLTLYDSANGSEIAAIAASSEFSDATACIFSWTTQPQLTFAAVSGGQTAVVYSEQS